MDTIQGRVYIIGHWRPNEMIKMDNDIQDYGWGLRFPDICLTVEKIPRKNLNQENWSYWAR